jgi:HAMP domain-containing protein
MVGLTALLFLFVLGFILKRRVLRPVVRLSDVVHRLASQDYAVETPNFNQIDEIGDMAQAIRIFRENGLAPASGKRARCRLGHPRAAGAHDPAAAGV